MSVIEETYIRKHVRVAKQDIIIFYIICSYYYYLLDIKKRLFECVSLLSSTLEM